MSKKYILVLIIIILAGAGLYLGLKPESMPDKSDLIQVNLEQNQEISSPLEITGKARGNWFFEGDFPIRLFDSNNQEIAVAIATAQGEWMTQDFVDFKATLEFEIPETKTGELVFIKDNPSDNRELDDELKIPVKFTEDVGCVPEGHYIPGAISLEYKKYMATECCPSLRRIRYSKEYDENCNETFLAGGPGGVCTQCGNDICESEETKCNCPEDCE